MSTLHFQLTNCYGIGSMNQDITFEGRFTTAVVYAPNGTMKTSLTKTIKQVLAGKGPSDELYTERQSSCTITIDGASIDKNNTYVFENKDADGSKQISTFLANEELRNAYNAIYERLDNSKKALKRKVKELAHSSDCEEEILEAFKVNEDDSYFDCVVRIKQELEAGQGALEVDFKFNDVFDREGRVKAFIEVNRNTIQRYFEKYEELLNESEFFSAGAQSFGTSQAKSLQKSVCDGRYFGAGHKMLFAGNREISSKNEIASTIQAEMDRILTDADIKKLFNSLEDKLDRNTSLRGFKDVIQAFPELIPELVDYNSFEKKVLRGYMRRCEAEMNNLTALYQAESGDMRDIVSRARNDESQWEKVINLFNTRFFVPFKLELTNKSDILLNINKTATLVFKYSDGGEAPIEEDKKTLIEHLSEGEQRAFFILQNIFEIEARRATGQDTLIVFDDVADSFDYRNKYAIIEYLYDIASEGHFEILILTHNFDFYRTVVSRLDVGGNVFFINKKEDRTIEFKTGIYKPDILKNRLLSKITERKPFIACIPFVRNLIEYTKGDADLDYEKLTSCLHQKDVTASIPMSDIWGIFSRSVKAADGKTITFGEEKFLDVLYGEAESVMADSNEVDIVNKLVLAMAIRLRAETYMKGVLSAAEFGEVNVHKNQTGELVKVFKKHHPDMDAEYRLMDSVLMLTSETIHLNNFMFEPLIDISIFSLKRLYGDVKGLQNEA